MVEPVELHQFRTKTVKRMERRKDVRDIVVVCVFIAAIVSALVIGMNV